MPNLRKLLAHSSPLSPLALQSRVQQQLNDARREVALGAPSGDVKAKLVRAGQLQLEVRTDSN